MRQLIRIGLWVLLSLTLACTQDSTSGGNGCESDDDCPASLTCNARTYACSCATDDACSDAYGEGFECNDFQLCQPRPPCVGNSDCGEGEICNSSDSSGGECIPSGGCGSTVHCDFNEYCSDGACKPGCREVGDCQLGYICEAGQCTPGDCSSCPMEPDPDMTYCPYGEICDNGACRPHTKKNKLCQSECSPKSQFDFNFKECGVDLICLVDPTKANGSYCSPVCQQNADCPSGYGSCNSLTIVSREKECQTDSQCNGLKCLKQPEDNIGFCECASDSECVPRGLCAFGRCLGSDILSLGAACTDDYDCLCDATKGTCLNNPGVQCSSAQECASSCTDVGGVQTCVTNWKACGKGDGVSCDDLKGVSPCEELNGTAGTVN
ncbi:MAG: hypothetical protein VYA34_17390 [Myxococcota bacterium]|nr:hypothetical protein [Myxococcota bacterium]